MPRPKLKPTARRTKWFKIRVSPSEHAALKKKNKSPISTKMRNQYVGKR